jgi:gamma-glutamylcyclotransferase (GGCT)/AIG2-like uncharacterized protein YtfP
MTELLEMNSMKRRETVQKVFVYGTLKKGMGNHNGYLDKCRLLGIGTTQGIMFHLGYFPAINLSEHFSPIMGEVYECMWDDILHMDMLEGVNYNHYCRVEIPMDGYGKVWTYIFDREMAARQEYVIPTGEWTGRDSPKLEWYGFTRGAAVGNFRTDRNADEIYVGKGNNHILRRDPISGRYKLIHKGSDIVLGTYSAVKDILSGDPVRPNIRDILSARRAANNSPQINNLPVVIIDPPKTPVVPTVVKKSYDEIMSEKAGMKVSQL